MRVVRLTNAIKYLSELIKYMVLYPIAVLKYSSQEIYLVSERGDEARDNGYYMFKFLREKHPELKAYFVIDQNSADLPKVSKYGNLVQPRSLKHYLLFIGARYKISTHIMGFSTFRYFYTKYYHLLPKFGKIIFLQHGVIQNNHPQLYKEKTNLDLFICGAKPEYDYICKNFHYTDEVKYTGLARYDGLQTFKVKNQILLMPTWRQYLKSKEGKEVEGSDYVKNWNAVLQNQKLVDALESANVELVFYPHYEMQKNLHMFKSNSSKVVIADFNHYDVQQLLKESKLLVTDYSSVFFDFAYMKKPVCYFQFDRKEFFSLHYSQGYFDYFEHGFGDVFINVDELVEAVCEYIKNDFKLRNPFNDRISGFFELHDDHNCERIFLEIENLFHKVDMA